MTNGVAEAMGELLVLEAVVAVAVAEATREVEVDGATGAVMVVADGGCVIPSVCLPLPLFSSSSCGAFLASILRFVLAFGV